MSDKLSIIGQIKNLNIKIKEIFLFSLLLLVIILTMIIMPYYVSGNLVGSNVNYNTLQVKQLAPEDLFVKRSFEYVDQIATQEKINDALKNVYPIFTYDVSKSYEIVNKIEDFSKNIENDEISKVKNNLTGLSNNEKELFTKSYNELSSFQKQLLSTWVFELSNEIIQSGFFDYSELESLESNQQLKLTLAGAYDNNLNLENISSNHTYEIKDLISLSNLEDYISSIIRVSGIYEELPINILYLSIEGLIQPNAYYNQLLSEKAKDDAINSVKDVTIYIQEGTKIISKDSIISESDLELLYQVDENNAIFSSVQIFARIILIFIITVLCFFYLYIKLEYTFRRNQFTYIYLILMSITIIISFFIAKFYSDSNFMLICPFLPVLFGTLFIRNTTSKKEFGFLFTIQYSLYAILFPGTSFFTFFYLATIGISFLYMIQYESDRISRIISNFKACLIAIAMTFITYAIQGYPFSDMYISTFVLLINIVLCIVLERLFLPFIDNKLNIPTIFRLEELSRNDNKLLTRLKLTAQGTYTHSVNVSELAYDAAKAIGVNANLCKVAALYHDVGKIEHPEYFTENQEDGVNKHDELTPSMSGSIIRSHVKLGVDLCKEEGLPKELIDIISEHHGNDVIQYFYNEAVKDRGNNELNRVEKLDYTYNGNPPISKESAIVMIADSVEAASKSQKTSAQKVGRLISNIVRGKLDRDQLIDSHLDLTELRIIEQSLEQSLVGKLHTRIKYQNDPDN